VKNLINKAKSFLLGDSNKGKIELLRNSLTKERFLFSLAAVSSLFAGLPEIATIGVQLPPIVSSIAVITSMTSWTSLMVLAPRVNQNISLIEKENALLRQKSKQSPKSKVIYQSKSRTKTRIVMEHNVSKAYNDFNNKVDYYKKWLDNRHKFYNQNPIAIKPTVEVLDRNQLLALRAVVTKYPSDKTCSYFASEIKNTLHRSGQKYVLRTNNH